MVQGWVDRARKISADSLAPTPTKWAGRNFPSAHSAGSDDILKEKPGVFWEDELMESSHGRG